MKSLYLHIGLPKTGSSALQSWFSVNAKALALQGIGYADLVPKAKRGEASSGNGFALFRALQEEDMSRLNQLVTEIYFGDTGNPTAVVSCEQLGALARPRLLLLRELFAQHNIQVHIIAYVRSIYERAYSAYSQDIRAKGRSDAFCIEDVERAFSRTQKHLLKYSRIFKDRLIVLNYDDTQRDIFEAFAHTTGIDYDRLDALEMRVNRSFSGEEVHVLRKINALHDGRFAMPLSKYLLHHTPERPNYTAYDNSILDRIRTDPRIDMEWINSKFNVSPQVELDQFEHRKGLEVEQQSPQEIYNQVALWLLEFAPMADDRASFKRFIGDAAALLATLDTDADVLAKINRKIKRLKTFKERLAFR